MAGQENHAAQAVFLQGLLSLSLTVCLSRSLARSLAPCTGLSENKKIGLKQQVWRLISLVKETSEAKSGNKQCCCCCLRWVGESRRGEEGGYFHRRGVFVWKPIIGRKVNRKRPRSAGRKQKKRATLIWNFLSSPIWLHLLKSTPAAGEETEGAANTFLLLRYFYFEEPLWQMSGGQNQSVLVPETFWRFIFKHCVLLSESERDGVLKEIFQESRTWLFCT